MQALYMDDSYLREFSASITHMDGDLIALNRTAFYPAGGGQPNDIGKIIKEGREFGVLNVIKKNGDIFHRLDSAAGLSVGDNATGFIDWTRRYMLMRHHTAAHVLSGVFHNETGALITGNQLDVDKSRIDFSMGDFDREQMLKYFSIANDLVKKDLEVKIYYMSREEAEKNPKLAKLSIGLPPGIKNIRVVDIVGFDAQADGGTHVKNLAEIGHIEFLKAENRGKNNRRVYYTVKQSE